MTTNNDILAGHKHSYKIIDYYGLYLSQKIAEMMFSEFPIGSEAIVCNFSLLVYAISHEELLLVTVCLIVWILFAL